MVQDLRNSYGLKNKKEKVYSHGERMQEEDDYIPCSKGYTHERKEEKIKRVYPTGEKNAEQINTKDLFNQHDNVLYIDFCKCKTKNFRIIKKIKKISVPLQSAGTDIPNF